MGMKLSVLLTAVLLGACSNADIHIADCQPLDGLQPVCGMQTPEDIAALDDGRHLLLAHFGGMIDGSGSLSLFDTQTERMKSLFPSSSSSSSSSSSAVVDVASAIWGDTDCAAPNPETFRPHGTHLHRLANGALRYLVVNHGERETVEMFEVLGNGAATRLQWRGCLEPAADTFMNDVVGLSSGDVIYTRMFHDAGTVEMLLSLIGFDTGDLWRWSKQTGPQLLPGTTANQPNGLEISPDERHVFANMYVTQELWKVDVDTGEIIDVAAVANADNSAWGSDGRLWVTTHTAPLSDMIACAGSQELACGASFAVIAVDPETMMTETIFAHAGPPMGAATVAVPQAGRVYMGSFVGDRLMSSVDFLQAAP